MPAETPTHPGPPRTAIRGPLLVAFAASVVMMSRLWEGDLHRDEVLYAAIAKTIVLTGDWLNLHIGSTPYWKKPPLMFWLSAGMYELFGVSVYTAKFFPALFGVLSCVMLYVVARRLFDDRIALFAGVVLATVPRYVRTAATFRLDSAVALFTLLTLFFYMRAVATSKLRDYSLAGASWGLAVMAKGAFGLIGPFVALIYLVVQRRLRLAFSKPFIVSVIVGAAVCLPWHLYEVAHWGTDFLSTYLQQEVIARMSGTLSGNRPPASYLPALVMDAWPQLAFIVLGTVYAAMRARRGDRNALFVLCWAFGYLALLHMSAYRRPRYLLQFYPPAAIAIDRLLPARWAAAAPRAIAASFAAVGFGLLVLPIPIHSSKARELKALRPVIDHFAPDPSTPLIGFRVRGLSLRASSIFYLNRDLRPHWRRDIPHDDTTLVMTERRNADRLLEAGFRQLHASDHYVLLHSPPAAPTGGQ